MRALLDLMIKDMENSVDLFKPTNFWEKGITDILHDLKADQDFENFRSHRSANSMYVPIYDHSVYKKHRKLIDKLFKVNYSNKPKPAIEGIFGLFSGYNTAKSDYRTFLATNKHTYPYLSELSESLIGNPVDFYNFNVKNYSRSFLNYLLGLNFLKNNVNTDNIKTVLEIGGGYGTLGEILLKSSPDIFYVNIDIPPVAAVSTFYLSKIFGEENVLSYEDSRNLEIIDIEELRKKYKCIVLCPWQIDKLKGEFDLFVNFMSFQEMEPHIVRNYISIVEKHTSQYILLRNSQSGKNLAKGKNDIGVLEPTATEDMYKMFKEFSLVNKDSMVYGQHTKDFVSEIACLSRANK